MTRSTSAMVRRSTGRRIGMPALLTITSRGPSSSQIRRARSAAASGSDEVGGPAAGVAGRSAGSRRPPASSRSARRATRATVAPPRGHQPGGGRTDARGGAGDQGGTVPSAPTRPVGCRVRRPDRGHRPRIGLPTRAAAGRAASTARARWPSRRSESRWSRSSGADLARVAARWPPAWRPCPAGPGPPPAWARGRCGRAWTSARPAGRGGACSRRPRSRTRAGAPGPPAPDRPPGPAARRRG